MTNSSPFGIHLAGDVIIIYVEGPIGSGKTTFINAILDVHKELHKNGEVDYDICCVFEPTDEWGIHLDKFYADPEKMAFEFQIRAATSRLKRLQQVITNKREEWMDGKIFKMPVFLVERSYLSDAVFAHANLKSGSMSQEQFDLYTEYVSFFIRQCAPKGSCHIFICPEVNTCIQRIEGRGLECEKDIDKNYMRILDELHQEAFNDKGHLNIRYFSNPAESDVDVRKRSMFNVFERARSVGIVRG